MVSPDYPKLEHNPFVTPKDNFFGGGGRRAQLNQLRRLSHWAQRLLVVTGDHGMGKTTIFKALATSLPAGVRAARINGTLISSTSDVLAEVAQGFGLAMPEGANSEVLSQLISNHVLEHDDRFCCVLIDDAHLIDPRALQQALELLCIEQGGNLYMVLFAEEQIEKVLKRAQREAESLSWQKMPLNALDAPNIRKYLLFRFAEAGHKGKSPFAEGQIEDICKGSAGNLGKINELADRELIRLERGQKGFPTLHRAVVLGICVLAVAVYVVFDALDGKPEAVAADVQGSVAGPLDPEPMQPYVDIGAFDDLDSETLLGEDPVETPDEAIEGEIDDAIDEESDEGIVAALDEPVGELPIDPDPAANAETEVELETTATDGIAQVQSVDGSGLPSGSTHRSEPMPADGDSVQDETWLLAQDGSSYTLQLLGTSSRANLAAYLAKQTGTGTFAVFESSLKGAPFYIVVYGIYPDRASAAAAATQLPASIGKVDPWVRPLASIQAAIR
ncbi:MAG: AAA family ATPase [Gammaproteobacteria bacterium]|nr:AAA family ATPase [Gammaproteobacteria bacterium]